jgi:hypothetical protein
MSLSQDRKSDMFEHLKSDNTFSCQDDHFSQIFPAAYQSSLKNIANDPLLPSKQISNISSSGINIMLFIHMTTKT